MKEILETYLNIKKFLADHQNQQTQRMFKHFILGVLEEIPKDELISELKSKKYDTGVTIPFYADLMLILKEENKKSKEFLLLKEKCNKEFDKAKEKSNKAFFEAQKKGNDIFEKFMLSFQ